MFPALMRPDLLEPPVAGGRVLGMNVSGFGAAEFGGVGIDVPVEIGEIPSAGDPRLCSVETGAWLVEALTDLGARFVVHVAAQRI
jgi:hypothetical protein